MERSGPEAPRQVVSHWVSCVLLSVCFTWCLMLFQGWDVGTMCNTLSRCITQDPRVGPSEACAIHPTWPLCLVACMNQAYCCACRLVHKWINEALRSLWAKPKSITSKCIGCMYVSWELLAAVAVIMFFQGWWCWVQLCVKVFLC